MGFDIFLDDIEPLHIERLPAQTVLKRLGNQLIQCTSPKISAFPVRRGELPVGSGKFLKNGVISVGSGRFW